MVEVTVEALQDRIRLDRMLESHVVATPVHIPLKKVRVFRASQLAKMCPVEAAFLIEAIHNDMEKTAFGYTQASQLPAHLTQIVDTGTVIHPQLQYYAGLVGYAKRGQWRCPSCGLRTSKGVPLPTTRKKDPRYKNFFNTYPSPCPRCSGRNLGIFPPWIYCEPEVVEQAPGWKRQFRTVGHLDQVWDVPFDGFTVPLITDYKTINEQGFTEQYGHLPKEDHVVQINSYLSLANADPSFLRQFGKIRFGCILYYDKNKSRHKPFVVKHDPSIWEERKAAIDWAREGDWSEIAQWRVCANVRHKRARECFFVKKCWGKNPPVNFLG